MNAAWYPLLFTNERRKSMYGYFNWALKFRPRCIESPTGLLDICESEAFSWFRDNRNRSQFVIIS